MALNGSFSIGQTRTPCPEGPDDAYIGNRWLPILKLPPGSQEVGRFLDKGSPGS